MPLLNFQWNGVDLDNIFLKNTEGYLVPNYANSNPQGGAYGWGYSPFGETGQVTDHTRPNISGIGPPTDFVHITAGANNTFGIKSNGTLWCWGFNYYGALGIGYASGGTAAPSLYQEVTGATNWRKVGAGTTHTLAVRTDGTLWATGDNRAGSLGVGDTTNRSMFTQVGALNNWQSADAGWFHSVAVKTDGTLWTWGYNTHGELGVGDTVARSSPVQVGALTTWQSVTAGQYFVAALKTDGTVWVWGYNYNAIFGNGTYGGSVSSPIQVGSSTDWKFIAAGSQNLSAIKTDGTLWTWGGSQGYYLGAGAYYIPAQVGAATNWKHVATAGNSLAAVRTDGTLWTALGNYFYQLGDGTQNTSFSFIQVGTGKNWVETGGKFLHFAGLAF